MESKKKRVYAEGWYDTIRSEVLKKYNYRCNKCNIKHRQLVVIAENGAWINVSYDLKDVLLEEGNKLYKVILHVCHINQNKEDNRIENLMALCVRCHSSFDAPYKFRRVKYA